MLRYRIPEIFLGVFLTIAVFGMGMLYQSSRHQPAQTQANQENTAQQSAQHQPERTVWGWITHDATGFFTLLLFVAVGIQAGLFVWQLKLIARGAEDAKVAADAAKDSANIARDSLNLSRESSQRELRAYVFPKGFDCPFETDRDGNAFRLFAVLWENIGETPARRVRMCINYGTFTGPIPPDFDFPDQSKPVTGILGPKTPYIGRNSEIPMEVFLKAALDEHWLYAWGWIEYNDVFDGTPRHRTEFRMRVIPRGDPRKADCPFATGVPTQHNAADEDCLKPVQTTGHEPVG